MVASRKILISQYRKMIPRHSLFLPSKWKANMTPQVEQLFCIFEEWGLTLGVAEQQESVWPWSWGHYGATAPASAAWPIDSLCDETQIPVWLSLLGGILIHANKSNRKRSVPARSPGFLSRFCQAVPNSLQVIHPLFFSRQTNRIKVQPYKRRSRVKLLVYCLCFLWNSKLPEGSSHVGHVHCLLLRAWHPAWSMYPNIRWVEWLLNERIHTHYYLHT